MNEDINYDAKPDEKFEERSNIEVVRDKERITGYKFTILLKDKPPLQGVLDREEVELMYRLYAAEGSNLTRRAVSRYFPLYTFQEFKKILTAFNITKASAPFAPHIVEEKTSEELIQLTLERKENDYLKKYELEKEALHIKKYQELLKSYTQLKQDVASFKEFVSDLKFDFDIKFQKPSYYSNVTLLVYLSDMHIGADVSNYSVYNNTYDKTVVFDRMTKVIDQILTMALNYGITDVIVCNLGDSLDGYNGQTTRGGHVLSQNMNNKDQYKTFLGVMINLFKVLSESKMFKRIRYICVEGGNHDGDFGYVANKALEASLEILNPEIEVKIFDRFMDHITVGNHTFIFCHGKDAKDMFKNLPLTLNDKTENQITEYIDTFKLTGKIHFIKGDLHQSATTYGRKFRYKSVLSFFGSSEWIHKNFGNTKAGINFDIVSYDTVYETQLLLN